MKRNLYSSLWFEVFGRTGSAERTEREVAFLARQLPFPSYRAVLDIACGTGRHARALAAAGYTVTGIDIDISRTGDGTPGQSLRLLELDMRDLSQLRETFDGIICMWQSFGYYDDATNIQILRDCARLLRPGGRLVLDIFNRDFFALHPEPRILERAGRTITERRRLVGERLMVTLDYGPAGPPDEFDWQVFTPVELASRAEAVGLRTFLQCAEFTETIGPSPDFARFQSILERPTE